MALLFKLRPRQSTRSYYIKTTCCTAESMGCSGAARRDTTACGVRAFNVGLAAVDDLSLIPKGEGERVNGEACGQKDAKGKGKREAGGRREVVFEWSVFRCCSTVSSSPQEELFFCHLLLDPHMHSFSYCVLRTYSPRQGRECLACSGDRESAHQQSLVSWSW